MNHTELTKAFMLDWPVYLIMYLGVGILSVIELILFYLYHKFMNRNTPRPDF